VGNKVGGLIAAADASLTITPTAGATTYILRAENGTAPCATNVGSTTPSIVVTANALPTVTITPTQAATTNICKGTSRTFTVQLQSANFFRPRLVFFLEWHRWLRRYCQWNYC